MKQNLLSGCLLLQNTLLTALSGVIFHPLVMYLFFSYENIFILVASCQNKTNSKLKKRNWKTLTTEMTVGKKNKVISNPTYYTILPTYYKYTGVEMLTHSSTLA